MIRRIYLLLRLVTYIILIYIIVMFLLKIYPVALRYVDSAINVIKSLFQKFSSLI